MPRIVIATTDDGGLTIEFSGAPHGLLGLLELAKLRISRKQVVAWEQATQLTNDQ